MRTWLSLVAVFSVTYAEKAKKNASEGTENPLAHGIGGDIEWVRWDEAIHVAKDLRKPIMLIMLRSRCKFCKRLKSKIGTAAESDEFVALSKNFVMVNVEDGEVPSDPKYAPDGRYVPRILFLDSDGEPLLTDNQNRRAKKYVYAFVAPIADAMKRALKEFEGISMNKTTTTRSGMAITLKTERLSAPSRTEHSQSLDSTGTTTKMQMSTTLMSISRPLIGLL
ncbi:unnamed protein product [Cylicocyclus nassatus]|uniref:Thioredoxin domain-containing protein n=1 Tax=Cylicocyclus nassatus TaxID=53992 RepID=A0AA36H0A5_CYLNA|nr:unnamed protein product [Cylicocyclus nassatus]